MVPLATVVHALDIVAGERVCEITTLAGEVLIPTKALLASPMRMPAP